MFLGNFEPLNGELTKIFGECYTDDNAVVLIAGDQKAVAYLEVVEDDKVIVEFLDERPDVTINVKGARPDVMSTEPRH
jgi:hypothetical protein